MDAQATAGLLRHFREINEFRAGNASHPLSSIISIAIMAVLCGAQGWVDVETWAQAHLQWLKTVLDLPHDIPSHDTSDHAHTDAAFFAEGIRSHWGVESMHWSLDVSMNEDQCRLRAENGAENFSRLRRIALNRLKQWQPRKPNGKPMKVGVRLKQRMCDWNPQYLLEVLRSYAIALE